MWSPELVRWPAERGRRARLARAGIPRVLVVAEGADLPSDIGDDEDWVRLPASEQDVAARVDNLSRRVRDAITLQGRILHTSRGAVTLTEREAAMVAALLEHRGALAPHHILATAVGSDPATARSVHDVASRLRRRLRPVGLDVFSARGRGYTLGLRIDDAERG